MMTKINDIANAQDAATEANRRWDAGNAAGQGYAVGDEGDNINDLGAEIGGNLIIKSTADSDVAVYALPDGREIAVGDANGPWAVDITH